jgi:hypothetical protein
MSAREETLVEALERALRGLERLRDLLVARGLVPRQNESA